MLTRCQYCGFYVSSFEGKCPDCGLALSLKKVTAGYLAIAKLPALFALFFSSVLAIPAAMLLFGSFYNNFQLFLSAAFVCLVVFGVLFYLQAIRNRPPDSARDETVKDSLSERQHLIERRTADLSQRSQRIDAVLSKITEDDGRSLQQVRQKLLTAREVLKSQRARYEIQKLKIDLVRLQNAVLPYLFNAQRLGEKESEAGLLAIQKARAKLDQMRRQLIFDNESDFPEAILGEKRGVFRQLDQTQQSCEQLREVILSRQATNALKGVLPMEDKFEGTDAGAVSHAVETFNLQHTLTDFGESFDELEREYERVLQESNASQKLLET